MPQLDAVTFLSQVTWLTLFFITYYLVGLRAILPALASRLKARGKKITVAKGRVSGFEGERLATLGSYDNVLGSSSAWVSGHVASVVTETEAWRQAQLRAADAGALIAANQAYVTALSSNMAQLRIARGRA